MGQIGRHWMPERRNDICFVAKDIAIEMVFKSDFCNTRLAPIWRSENPRKTYKFCKSRPQWHSIVRHPRSELPESLKESLADCPR